MNAVPAAVDVLIKYVERVKNDAISLNNLGLLLERQKLYIQASERLTEAYNLLPEENDFKAMVAWNCARVYWYVYLKKISCFDFLIICLICC